MSSQKIRKKSHKIGSISECIWYFKDEARLKILALLWKRKEKKTYEEKLQKEIMRHVEKMLPSSNMIQALHNSVGRRGMMIRPAIQLIIKVFEIWFSKKAQDIINLVDIPLLNWDTYPFIGKFLNSRSILELHVQF